MAKDEEKLKLLMDIQNSINEVDKTVAVQTSEMKSMSSNISEIKDEQVRQNSIVTDHERRSLASEGRLGIIEGQHEIFKTEHAEFKTRITVAEQPSLILKNIWRGIITLGTGAGAMYGILKLLNLIKDA